MTALPDPFVVVGDPGTETVDAWGVQRDLEALALADIDTGDQQFGIRFGVATVTFTAAMFSNVVVVNHGLGRAPVAVVATSNTGAGIDFTVSVFTATTFSIQGAYPFANLTQNANASWIAIG